MQGEVELVVFSVEISLMLVWLLALLLGATIQTIAMFKFVRMNPWASMIMPKINVINRRMDFKPQTITGLN